MYREMNKTEIASIVLLGILVIFIAFSYGFYLKPNGKQEQSTLALVLITSVITSIVIGLFAYVGLNGNTNAQLNFFIPIMILVLLPTCIISATVSANQLYGLREAVAAGKQT